MTLSSIQIELNIKDAKLGSTEALSIAQDEEEARNHTS